VRYEIKMADERGFFDFERLTVYQRALEFADFVFELCKKMSPDYRNSIVNQLQRAAVSVANNIAEGSGKLSRREKIKYYSYALDSAKECIPPLTMAHRQKQITDSEHEKGRQYGSDICKMMVKLIQSVKAQELHKEVREEPGFYL
jgi:four helix bundle protein